MTSRLLGGCACLVLALGCGGKREGNAADPVDPGPPPPPAAPGALRLNEVVSANATTLVDENGETGDWIELYNAGPEAISLAGYHLSDSGGDLTKWTFGDVTLGPDQYLVVFADGTDVRQFDRTPPAPLHGLTEFVWSWADGQFEPAGGSRVDPVLFPDELSGLLDGKRAISADLVLANNQDTLGWSVAMVHLGFAGWESTTGQDLSGYNHAVLEATLAADAEVRLQLCRVGVECGDELAVSITGNGVERFPYDIPLTRSELGTDLAALHGLQLHAVTEARTTRLLVTDLTFSHTGYFLHTNFNVSAEGETLVLSDPEGNELDRQRVPALRHDLSYGRSPEAPAEWVFFDAPTPGTRNADRSFSGVCPAPVLEPPAGFFAGPLEVTATGAEDCAVRTTTDGSVPTSDLGETSAPVAITQTTALRAVAVAEGKLPSEPVTQTYFVNEEHSVAVVSLTTDPALLFDPVTGIYELGPNASPDFPYKGANFWKDTEIPVHFEFFAEDGSRPLATGAGLRMFGNYSRGYPMRSVSLYFRDEYGLSQVEQPMFPEHPELTVFEALVLRNGGNEFGHSTFRDELTSSLTEGMGLSYQEHRPAVVYIDGAYWGLYQLREKLNEDYFLTHFGLTPAEFDLLGPGGEVLSGSTAEWDALLAQLEITGATAPADYAALGAQIDIDNFIDYNCVELYSANQDWPGNNVKWWKVHGPEGRWRWALYDLDFAFREPTFDMLTFVTTVNDAWPNPEWSTFLMRTLVANPEFQRRFSNRCAVWLATNFEPARVTAQIAAMEASVAAELPRSFARWDLDLADFQSSLAEIRDFALARPALMRQHFAAFFAYPGTFQLDLRATGGEVQVEGIPIPAPGLVGTFFVGSPLKLTAVPAAGSTFVRWSDGETAAERSVVPSGDIALVAEFE